MLGPTTRRWQISGEVRRANCSEQPMQTSGSFEASQCLGVSGVILGVLARCSRFGLAPLRQCRVHTRDARSFAGAERRTPLRAQPHLGVPGRASGTAVKMDLSPSYVAALLARLASAWNKVAGMNDGLTGRLLLRTQRRRSDFQPGGVVD